MRDRAGRFVNPTKVEEESIQNLAVVYADMAEAAQSAPDSQFGRVLKQIEKAAKNGGRVTKVATGGRRDDALIARLEKHGFGVQVDYTLSLWTSERRYHLVVTW